MLNGIRFKGVEYSLDELKKENPLTDTFPTIVLDQLSNTREWSGVPHVTDLCIDTREAFLKYSYNYTEDADHAIRMAMGSIRHASILSGELTEVTFENVDVTGSADLFDVRPNGDLYLTDIKFYSSYSVAKHLGITTEKKPLVNDQGNISYYKNGKQKMKTYVIFQPPQKNYVTLQLNIYAYFLEKLIKENKVLQKKLFDAGAHIYANIDHDKIFDKLAVFMYVTDGGTWMAKNRGIYRNSYYDNEIDLIPGIGPIIETKVSALKTALAKGVCPPMCKDIYCMDDRYKCNNFCPVRDICSKIGGEYQQSPF